MLAMPDHAVVQIIMRTHSNIHEPVHVTNTRPYVILGSQSTPHVRERSQIYMTTCMCNYNPDQAEMRMVIQTQPHVNNSSTCNEFASRVFLQAREPPYRNASNQPYKLSDRFLSVPLPFVDLPATNPSTNGKGHDGSHGF